MSNLFPTCEECKEYISGYCDEHLPNETTEVRKKNQGKAYYKNWPSYKKTLTGKPVGRPRKIV